MNEKETKKTLGTFISELRKEKGYTQGELSELLHISNKTISSWETDKTQPDVQMIPLLADIFDITCDELLNGKKNDKNDYNINTDNVYNTKGNIKLVVHRIVTALLCFILVVMCVCFYDVLTQLKTGFPPFETKIVNDVAYEKNVNGTWSVVGVSENFRGDTIIIKDTINGAQVTQIATNAFRNVSTFDTIIFSKNITTIESSAFMHCLVSNVVLNDGLLKIENHAFSHSNIKELYLPDSLMNIGVQAFDSCVYLNKITGGKGLVFVDRAAFCNCVMLESVSLEGTITFEQCVFENTVNLKTAKLPNVVSLGAHQFENSGLVTLYLPSNYNHVLLSAVYNCYKLQSIYLGDELQNIKDILGD